MATEKIGIYRRWLAPAPKENGVEIPKERWPKIRQHCWQVRWFGTTGKRYSKNFKTRKLAEQYQRKLQEQVNKGKADRPSRITISEFIVEHKKLMQGQVAYATLKDQMRALKFFENFIGGSTVLTSMNSRQAESFISERFNSGVSAATVNKDITTLKRVFNLAIDPRGYLHEDQNPFAKIKRRKKTPKPLRYVSVEEYNKIFQATEDLWWHGVMAVAYGSGLRREEILNLTWPDIDFTRKLVKITAKDSTFKTIEWEPKDHEIRVVPMSSQAKQLLEDIHLICPEHHIYPFISPARLKHIMKRIKAGIWNPTCHTQNNLIRDFKVIQRRAGIVKCTLHDLRRSAITNWAQFLPIQVVQTLAGHANISTTREYYLMVRNEDMDNASKAIDEILEKAKI